MNNLSLRAYLLYFLKKYKFYFLLLIIIALIAAIASVSVEYKIKEIIDAIATKKIGNLELLLVLFVFYKLISHGSFLLSRFLNIKYMPLIIEKTVLEIYTKTIRHSLYWFDSHLSGEISSKILDFQSAILTLILYSFRAVSIIFMLFISMLFLFKVNIFTGLVLLCFILLYVPIIFFLLKKQVYLQKTLVFAKQKAIGVINDSILNIFTIKIIGNSLKEIKFRLKPAINEWKEKDKIARKFDTYFVDNIDTIMITAMSGIQIYLLAHLMQNGSISAGGFAFIAMMTLKLHRMIAHFLENLLFNINPSLAKIKSSYSFVNKNIDVQDKLNALNLKNVKGDIEYKNVSFSYDSGKPVFKNFNLSIKAGERVGIVGHSGVGKTTLVKCLLRYFDINKGSILLDGHDIRDITQESLWNSISIIPQDITLFHRSIIDNLKIAKYDATKEEIINACKYAKIHNDIMRMSEGYNTIVGERGAKLSGGQRQRIAIARAILKNGSILILDEATSNLDSQTESLIQGSINKILDTSSATVIAIAHRLSTLKHMNRIIVLDDGKLIEEGTHSELIKINNGLYKKLWEEQEIIKISS